MSATSSSAIVSPAELRELAEGRIDDHKPIHAGATGVTPPDARALGDDPELPENGHDLVEADIGDRDVQLPHPCGLFGANSFRHDASFASRIAIGDGRNCVATVVARDVRVTGASPNGWFRSVPAEGVLSHS